VGNSWSEFEPLLWSFGGAFSDERLAIQADAPPAVAAVQFLADLVHKHRVAVATQRAQPEFTQGTRAFLLTSTANLTQVVGGAQFRVGVAPVPGGASGALGASRASGSSRARAIPGGGAGLSILATTAAAKQEAGWQFLRHMTSSESSAFFARATGYAPVRPAALARADMRAFLDEYPQARLAQEQIQYVRPVDAILAAPEASTKIQEALAKVLFQGESVPATCDALAAALRQSAQQVRR
jgi:sn-glycerol 3-phosphate transport system substrate-binding protein